MAEISTKPYLIRAIYEWCCDNGYTPHLVVKAGGRARLPMAYVRNGEIVPKSQYAQTRLAAGDRLEIVVAVGGG